MAAATGTGASDDLSGRVVVVGVTGGIAAYKAVEVCRRLVDAGAHVVPVMTEGAEHFIGRTTLSALCSEPVQTSPTSLTFRLNGQAGVNYAIWATTDLVNWLPLTSNLLTSASTNLTVDALGDRQFYRALWLP